jgi:hypothetical protein
MNQLLEQFSVILPLAVQWAKAQETLILKRERRCLHKVCPMQN